MVQDAADSYSQDVISFLEFPSGVTSLRFLLQRPDWLPSPLTSASYFWVDHPVDAVTLLFNIYLKLSMVYPLCWGAGVRKDSANRLI